MSRTSHLNTLQWLSQADSVKVLESASALPSTCHNSRETLLRLCLCMGMCLVCQRNTDPTVTTVHLLGLASMDILEIGDWWCAYQSQRIKDCFEPLLLFLQHFFLSATFFLHLLHSAGETSICFWMLRFFSGMVCSKKYQIDMHQQHQSQWLSIWIHCITISDLQIRRVYLVYVYFRI